MDSNVEQVRVLVNGKEVALNAFVKAIFASTVMGMVSALKTEDNAEDIEIHVRIHQK